MAGYRPLLHFAAVAASVACGGGGRSVEPPPATLTLVVTGEMVPGPAAGQSYVGRNGYIEHVAGNSPVGLM